MFQDFKEFFEDDYICTKRFRIKPLSLLWWAIRGGQALLGLVGFFGIYALMWLALM